MTAIQIEILAMHVLFWGFIILTLGTVVGIGGFVCYILWKTRGLD